ncbi:hypothetical protein G6F35_015573 [Rhizopus arrhizus]|nr:hypothetical protein G6F35_015573 [Rhizopus arrhizus]
MFGRWRFHARHRVDVLRVDSGEPRGGQRNGRQHQQDRAAHIQHGMAAQRPDGAAQARARYRKREGGRVHALPFSVADAGVEEPVAQVDQQVDQHVDARGHQQHALDHRVVVAQHGVDGQAAQAGNREHGFGNYDAANQQGHAHADGGDDGVGGVLQRMPHDGSRRQALGARGADVVLGQGLQHGGARHARQQRHVDQTQRQAGQHQVAQTRL